MTVLVVVIGVLIAAFIAREYLREGQHAEHLAEREKTWDLERGSILREKADLEGRYRADREADRESYAALIETQQAERDKWGDERSELLTRIQHPEVILPSVPVSDPVEIRHEEDEIELIGSVVDGAENG